MSVNSMILCVCVCYFIGVIAVGMYASRRAKKASDYLVAGRQLGWVRTGITLSAVQIGVGIVLSGATRGYEGWGMAGDLLHYWLRGRSDYCGTCDQ